MLLLGPDLKEELPVLFLRLRHAVTRDGVKVVELATQRTLGLRPRRRHAAPPSRRRRRGGAGPARRLGHPGGRRRRARRHRRRRRAARGRARSPSCSGRRNVAESADGVVAAAVGDPRRPPAGAVPRARCAAATCTAPSTWGSPPACCPGRTSLADGGAWFKGRGWPKVPAPARPRRHRDPAGGRRRARSTCSSCSAPIRSPTSPTPTSPPRALAGARTVIAVDRFLTASAQQADVVLAASGPAETDGTTTNLEGRISTVARKITPPGTARDDWMLAAELARLLGADLGVESAAQILEEIVAVAPSHVGLTADAIQEPRRVLVGGRRPPHRSVVASASSRRRRGRSPPTPPTRESSRPPRPRPPRRRRTPTRPSEPRTAGWLHAPHAAARRRRLLAAAGRQPPALRPRHRRPALARAGRPHQRHRAAPPPARLRPARRRRPAAWSPPPRRRAR